MHELLALWTALSPSEQYVLIGFFGILLSLPIGELISLEFYSIVDFFAAFMLMGLVFLSIDNANPTQLSRAVVILLLSLVIIFLKIFFILPFMHRAERTTVLSFMDYEGREGRVSTHVTKEAVGEIWLSTPTGRVVFTACLYENDQTKDIQELQTDEPVLIVEMRGSVAYVTPLNR